MTKDTTSTEMTTVDEQAAAEVATIIDPVLLQQFAEMAVMIPAEVEGGTEDILRKVLSAKTWSQVDEPWRTTDVDDILRKRLRVVKVTRRPSTFAQGLGMFLIVKLRDPRDGQEYVKTTGSVAVVGQFAALYAMGATAMTIEWCKAERPTEQGYYPQHIVIHDAHVPGVDGGQ
jgi:phosphoribosylaminoimidazole (AIR) synthetase